MQRSSSFVEGTSKPILQNMCFFDYINWKGELCHKDFFSEFFVNTPLKGLYLCIIKK